MGRGFMPQAGQVWRGPGAVAQIVMRRNHRERRDAARVSPILRQNAHALQPLMSITTNQPVRYGASRQPWALRALR